MTCDERSGAQRPTGLETAPARKNDLLLANQTYKRLELHQLQIELRQEVARLAARLPAEPENGAAPAPSSRSRTRAIFYLSYRAPRLALERVA